MLESLVDRLAKLPSSIYEDTLRSLFKIPTGSDCGTSAYNLKEFLATAQLIIESDAYKHWNPKTAYISVQDNILLLAKSSGGIDTLLFERYLAAASTIMTNISEPGYMTFAVAMSEEEKHCVRCHQEYQEGDGDRCTIGHIISEEFESRVRGVKNTYIYKCEECEYTIAGSAHGFYDKAEAATSNCIDDIHTQDESLVDYNHFSVERCRIVNGKCELQSQ